MHPDLLKERTGVFYEQKGQEDTAEAAVQEELVQQFMGYQNPYSTILIESKNLIFRGATETENHILKKGNCCRQY